VGNARYQFVCPWHGPCGSSPVRRSSFPTPPSCPTCGHTVEVWVGDAPPATDDVRGLSRAS
jgi:hypothetical protein